MMYWSVAPGYTPFTSPYLALVDVLPGFKLHVPAVIAVSSLSFILPVVLLALLLAAAVYIWYLRKQLIHINRTGKVLINARLNMISNISQEVRTPLNAIVGFSEQLSYTTLDNQQRELLASVEDAAAMLIRIQKNIQELTWIQKGELFLETYPFQLHKIFTSVTDRLRSQAVTKKLTFDVSFEGEKQIQVAGDAQRLDYIIGCLVENAIMYTDSGSVHCSMFVDRQMAGEVRVTIRITDTGRGIPSERLPFIFEQYAYHNAQGIGTPHGAGISLALVKALLHLHNGNIIVESLPGKGSIFTCHVAYRVLPLPQTMIITQKEIEQMTGHFMKGRYVLVADDQEMNLVLMEKILTRWQCRFDKAPDGVTAYELFSNNNYDMVLLDLQMPCMTGLEVVKRIRKHEEPLKANVPVLALTADTTMPVNQEFIDAGFDDYLLKPFREKEIYNTIIRHLRPQDTFINASH